MRPRHRRPHRRGRGRGRDPGQPSAPPGGQADFPVHKPSRSWQTILDSVCNVLMMVSAIASVAIAMHIQHFDRYAVCVAMGISVFSITVVLAFLAWSVSLDKKKSSSSTPEGLTLSVVPSDSAGSSQLHQTPETSSGDPTSTGQRQQSHRGRVPGQPSGPPAGQAGPSCQKKFDSVINSIMMVFSVESVILTARHAQLDIYEVSVTVGSCVFIITVLVALLAWFLSIDKKTSSSSTPEGLPLSVVPSESAAASSQRVPEDPLGPPVGQANDQRKLSWVNLFDSVVNWIMMVCAVASVGLTMYTTQHLGDVAIFVTINCSICGVIVFVIVLGYCVASDKKRGV